MYLVVCFSPLFHFRVIQLELSSFCLHLRNNIGQYGGVIYIRIRICWIQYFFNLSSAPLLECALGDIRNNRSIGRLFIILIVQTIFPDPRFPTTQHNECNFGMLGSVSTANALPSGTRIFNPGTRNSFIFF